MSIPEPYAPVDVDESHVISPARQTDGHSLVDRLARQGRMHTVPWLFADDDEPWIMSLSPHDRTKLTAYLADLQRSVLEVLPAHRPGMSLEQVRHALTDDAAVGSVRRALSGLVMAGAVICEHESDAATLYHRVSADQHSA